MPVKINAIQKLTSPNPFCLITARRPDGSANVMALSWWTYVSNHPAMIAVSMSARGYTHELIEASGEFALCLPGEKWKDAAFSCGTCSGRTCDKAAKFGIPLVDAAVIKTPVVADCRAVLECRVVERIPVGDSLVFIGEVVATSDNPAIAQLYAIDGYAKLSVL